MPWPMNDGHGFGTASEIDVTQQKCALKPDASHYQKSDRGMFVRHG